LVLVESATPYALGLFFGGTSKCMASFANRIRFAALV
jgi:hypothetical protein